MIDNEQQLPENNPEPLRNDVGAGDAYGTDPVLAGHIAPPPSPRPIWNYKDLLVVLGLAIPSFVVAMLSSGMLMFVSSIKEKNVLALPAEFVGYLIWFLLMATYLRTKYNLRFWSALGWHWQGHYVGPALLGGFALAIAVGLTGYILKTPRMEEGLVQDLLKNPITRVMVIISATTIGPVCEELLFRGFILPLLARTFGAVAGVLLTALPFALLHGPQYKWTWQLVLLIFMAGCAFGWTRYRTGSTATSTVMHAAYNSLFFVTYFAQKGLDF